MGSSYDAQAGPKLLASNAPPALVSQSAGIKGMSHCTQPCHCLLPAFLQLLIPMESSVLFNLLHPVPGTEKNFSKTYWSDQTGESFHSS
ncbi:hypothetical protein AAY473_020472 [Plecturocebus cupreus]